MHTITKKKQIGDCAVRMRVRGGVYISVPPAQSTSNGTFSRPYLVQRRHWCPRGVHRTAAAQWQAHWQTHDYGPGTPRAAAWPPRTRASSWLPLQAVGWTTGLPSRAAHTQGTHGISQQLTAHVAWASTTTFALDTHNMMKGSTRAASMEFQDRTPAPQPPPPAHNISNYMHGSVNNCEGS